MRGLLGFIIVILIIALSLKIIVSCDSCYQKETVSKLTVTNN